MKKLSVVALLSILLMSVFAVGVSAQSATQNTDVPVEILDIEINGIDYFAEGDDINNLEQPHLDRGEDIEVVFKFRALVNGDDFDLEGEIRGVKSRYQSEDEHRFGEVLAGRTYTAKLTLPLSDGLDHNDDLDLRFTIAGKTGDTLRFTIPATINSKENDVSAEVLLSPGSVIEAGRSLFVQGILENKGQTDEDDVLVTASIPELGISDKAFIEEIESDEDEVSPELFLSIPRCADGSYEGVLTVEYDDRDEVFEETFELTVMQSNLCDRHSEDDEDAGEDKTVITVVSTAQNVMAGGAAAVYPIALTNAGSDSKTYTFEPVTGNGVSVMLSDNLVVLAPGESKVVSAGLSASEETPSGAAMATVLVKSGDELVEQVTLSANVQAGEGPSGLKSGLTIALIVLVVLLVILGLIIGFSRLKDDDDFEDEDQDDKTYY